jgi:phage terminase large subunit
MPTPMAIWIVQWVGQEIRVLDYIRGVGQVLAYYVNWMREKGYEKAINYLPHDGVNENNITGKRYEDHWRDAGFTVEPPVKNQGKGAASMRVEAVRRLWAETVVQRSDNRAGARCAGLLPRTERRKPQCWSRS